MTMQILLPPLFDGQEYLTHAERLDWLRREVKKGQESGEKEGWIPMEDVFRELKKRFSCESQTTRIS